MSLQEVFSTPEEQVRKWRGLNEWLSKSFAKEAISDGAFAEIEGKIKGLGRESRIFCGLGDDGQGHSDSLLTGHIFLTHLTKKFPYEKSRFLDFYPAPPDPKRFEFFQSKIKLREGAAPRPKGFYIKELLPKDREEGIGAAHRGRPPAEIRKLSPWCFGPEGFQFLALEERYVALLRERAVPFFVLADYAIAPYGGDDFYSTVYVGSDRDRLDIGVTNARDNIAKFSTTHFA